MNRTKLLRRLEKQRDDLALRIALELEGASGQAQDDEVRKLQQHIAVLSALRTKRRFDWIAAATAGLGAVAVLILTNAKPGLTTLHMTVACEGVSVRLAEAFHISEGAGISSTQLDLVGVSTLSPPWFVTSGNSKLDATGGHIALTELNLDRGDLLRFVKRANDIGTRLDIISENWEGVFGFSDGTVVSMQAGGSPRSRRVFRRMIPERMRVIAGKTRSSIHIDDTVMWQLNGIKVNSVAFADERAAATPGDLMTISTVVNGIIAFTNAGTKAHLGKGDRLEVTGFRGELTSLTCDGGITLEARGVAQDVKTTSEGLLASVKPTWLEQLYHQRSNSLILGSIAVFWGWLWAARRFFQS